MFLYGARKGTDSHTLQKRICIWPLYFFTRVETVGMVLEEDTRTVFRDN